MADLTITATQVLPGTLANGARFSDVVSGATITAGQVVYLDTAAADVAKLADNDALASAVVKGIALHAASAGQPLRVQTGGPITLGAGAAMTVAVIYVLSSTAGAICPAADLAADDYTSILGVATTAAILDMDIINSGAKKA
jgi:hypothetical protein